MRNIALVLATVIAAACSCPKPERPSEPPRPAEPECAASIDCVQTPECVEDAPGVVYKACGVSCSTGGEDRRCNGKGSCCGVVP